MSGSTARSMSAEVYRGVTMPEPYGGRLAWVINDGAYGYITASSRSEVIQHWRHQVDLVVNGSAEYQNVTYVYDLLIDPRTGLVFADLVAYEAWLASLNTKSGEA